MVQSFVARKCDNSSVGGMGINGMKKWSVLSRVINGEGGGWILKLDNNGDALRELWKYDLFLSCVLMIGATLIYPQHLLDYSRDSIIIFKKNYKGMRWFSLFSNIIFSSYSCWNFCFVELNIICLVVLLKNPLIINTNKMEFEVLLCSFMGEFQ